jgi:hypothetical protein
MLNLKSRADLQRCIDERLTESLVLDYKASPALGRDPGRKNELAKDVSAFANSAGGQIVYGIEEHDSVPVRIDQGLDPTEITKEWLEQVIDTNVFPRIEGLLIDQVALDEGRVAYVINVPQATSRAPHQAPDKRYYRRQNFQNVAMEDYEIRDMLRRSVVSEPFLTFKFQDDHDAYQIQKRSTETGTEAVPLITTIGNRSREPIYYAVISVLIDTRLHIRSLGQFEQAGTRVSETGQAFTILRKKLSIPANFPVFQEVNLNLSGPPISIGVAPEWVNVDGPYHLGYDIRVPGRIAQGYCRLIMARGQLILRPNP